MESNIIDIHKAIQDAKDLADFIITMKGTKYPGFHTMSDARICATLLRDMTGKNFYAIEVPEQDGKFCVC